MSTGSEVERVWRRRLERHEAGAMTAVEFCRLEGVSTASFYQWRRRLASSTASRDEAKGSVRGNEAATFLPVRWTPSAGQVELFLPNGTRVTLPTQDAELLRIAIETAGRLDVKGAASC